MIKANAINGLNGEYFQLHPRVISNDITYKWSQSTKPGRQKTKENLKERIVLDWLKY